MATAMSVRITELDGLLEQAWKKEDKAEFYALLAEQETLIALELQVRGLIVTK